jgi:DNA-binding transcriptional LysR family regulator
MPVRDVAPDEWECRVFIAVAEHRTFAAAAKALSAQTGKAYGSRAVAKVIAKIERWLGVPPFEQTLSRAKQTTTRGEDFLRAARAIVGEYQALREPERAFTVPTLACMPHHLQVVARAEAALAQRPGLRVEFLDRDSYVGATAFGRYAVGRLQRDRYQLVVGPPVSGDATLVSKDLYEARLEAMVPAARGPTPVALTDLVQEYQVFLPPLESRSRRLFEDRLAEWAPGLRNGVPAQRASSETTTNVLRVCHRPNSDRCAVVASSDVALAFKPGREFGGSQTERFVWVPIYHRDADGVIHQLTQRVSVTVKRTDAAALFPVMDQLRRAVSQVPELAHARIDLS